MKYCETFISSCTEYVTLFAFILFLFRVSAPKTHSRTSAAAQHVFPPPVTLTTTNNFSRTPAVLIVGGTDGSGTRRVVQILTELGVKMVSEDPETYDIHADLVGGWPK